MIKGPQFTCLLVVVVSLLLLVPDVVFSIVDDSFKVSHDIRVLMLILPLSFGLVTNPYRWFSIVIIAMLTLLQIMQFSHIAYFGTQLSPYAMHLMLSEIDDVILESCNVVGQYAYIIPIVVVPFALIYLLVRQKCCRTLWGTLSIITVFAIIGGRLYSSVAPRFMPNEIRFSLDNSIKAFCGYWIIHMRDYAIKSYKPYDVIPTNVDLPAKVNIVYIIGESVNYNHMSLFGYGRETTPQLKSLAKQENFYYTKGIAGSIATFSSCKFIMSAIGEPDNVMQTSQDTTNLFRLAKLRGFKTFYISNQIGHLLSAVGGVKYIDVIITQESDLLKFNEYMDEYLIQLLEKQEFGDRNFIVIHQRCIHSPYTKAFAKDYTNREQFSGSKNKKVNEYDNAMLYNDYLISKMFNKFNKTNERFYVIWASDHNELMGEKGLYGHGHGYLVPQTADIPVMIQTNDEQFLAKIKQIYRPTHYEIAKSLASLLGFTIKNPNEKQDAFFITGIDYNGKCGYIPFKKDNLNRTIQYLKN